MQDLLCLILLSLNLQRTIMREDLWREAALLDRLLYKNASQHRQAKYFKQLCGVSF